MKRKVQISFEVDANWYQNCGDTPEEVVELVEAMMLNQADFPLGFNAIEIECEGQKKRV